MTNAWMIRNDGKVFPCISHIYANKDVVEVEETIYAGEWLYNHTNHESTKELVIKLIAAWIDGESNRFMNRSDALYNLLSNLGYIVLSKDFIKLHEDEINTIKVDNNLASLNSLVDAELNQEFMRVRYGGFLNTYSGSHELVFRISSSGFNWFNIIWNFVFNMRSKVDTVTICKDPESTGLGSFESPKFYILEGEVTNQMDINKFITLGGNPIVESYININCIFNKDKLSEGKSILESFPGMNTNRLMRRLERYSIRELNDEYTSEIYKGRI